mgnify:CR=1 FL=1
MRLCTDIERLSLAAKNTVRWRTRCSRRKPLTFSASVLVGSQFASAPLPGTVAPQISRARGSRVMSWSRDDPDAHPTQRGPDTFLGRRQTSTRRLDARQSAPPRPNPKSQPPGSNLVRENEGILIHRVEPTPPPAGPVRRSDLPCARRDPGELDLLELLGPFLHALLAHLGDLVLQLGAC